MCRIKVPAPQLAEASELLAAYKRGDFELGDDFEDGEPTSSQIGLFTR
jgi:hypothetical protein